MSTDEARGRSLLKLIAWPFFRQPGTGRYRCAAAGVLALVATTVGILHSNPFRLPAEPLSPDGHASLALEQALVWNLCGKYGATSADFVGDSQFLRFDLSAADKPYAAGIAEKYGSVDRYCGGVRQNLLNNENSLFLLEAALLALPPDDSLKTLAAKLTAFRYALLFLSLAVLAFLGVGLLPLLLVSVTAARAVGVTQATHLLSIYPTMTILLLFSGALIALFSGALRAARIGRLVVAAVGLGLAFAFIYNWRTSYGPIVLGQLVLALLVVGVSPRRAPRGLARYGMAAAGIAAGFLLFQSTFIWSLQRNIPAGYNYAHHVVWHPIVLGLANPPSALAEREGIEWNDLVGLTLAKRVDARATYKGPTYEAALARYYFGLWKNHAWEMLAIYRSKVFETTRSMMSALGPLYEWPLLGGVAQKLIPNGYVWVGVVLALGVLAIAAGRPFPALHALSAALVAALLLVTAEQAITIPTFLAIYQGSLIVNFAALVAIVAALACAWLMHHARIRDSGTAQA